MRHLVAMVAISALFLVPHQAFGAQAQGQTSGTTQAAKQYQLETILVTAKKVEADKQDVPASITVFDAHIMQDMALDTFSELSNISPNIASSAASSRSNQIVFRGIGGLTNHAKLWNINVDGVVIPYGAINTFLDVDHIELIRGGQSALYGRNTYAGAVNIITRDPGDEFEANTSLAYESYNTIKTDLALGGPINDTLGYRLAVAYKHTDGYVDNIFLNKDDVNEADHFTMRGKLVLTPDTTNELTLSLNADYYEAGFDDFAFLPLGADNDQAEVVSNVQGSFDEGYLFSPSLVWKKEFTSFNLTSISNYSRSNYHNLQDLDSQSLALNALTYNEDFNNLSQELRLSGGEGSNFQWLAGVYGLIEQIDTSTDIAFGADAGPNAGRFQSQDSTENTYVLASFGQITYKPISQLELTASARLDYEKKELEWANDNDFNNPTRAPLGTVEHNDDWLALSPSFSVAWLFNDEHQTYASISRGFKAGSYNTQNTQLQTAQSIADPEFSTTYEIGYKGQYFKKRLETNVALFYIDWEDMQVDTRPEGSRQFVKVNAGSAHSTGLELETRALLMPGWEAFFNVGYMFEYEFDEFSTTSNITGLLENRKGDKLPGTNEFSVSVGSIYRTDFGMFLSFNASYQGEKYLTERNRYKENPYLLVNAKIGYEAENWEVYLYGKNLLDEYYATFANDSGATGSIVRQGEPLIVGAAVAIRF